MICCLSVQVGEHAIDYAHVAQKEKLSELQLRVRQLLDQVLGLISPTLLNKFIISVGRIRQLALLIRILPVQIWSCTDLPF
jgi:hypothetical protein